MSTNIPKVNRSSALKVYEWCKKKYGRSKFNGRYPDIYFRKPDYTTEDVWGLYDCEDNYIYINSDMVKNIEELTSTVIHEYTHYKQNMRVDWRVLSKYFDPTSNDHPLEKEAEDVSQRDTHSCIKEVFGI
jgi:Zn-dependent peptidase ImmA (M78 family)